MGGTRRVRVVAVAAVLVVLTACEGAIEHNVERLLAPDPPTRSATLRLAARARSQAMCAAGTVVPTPDPEAVYGPGVVELVDSEPFDPPDDDSSATTAIWRRWRDDPLFQQAPWRWMAAGEEECDDGRLYMTLLLQSPVVDHSGLVPAPDVAPRSSEADLSTDGDSIAFLADDPDQSPPNPAGIPQLHVWDRSTGLTTQITSGNLNSYAPSISGDGGVVAFSSQASDLAPGDANGTGGDVFVWVRATGAITRVTGGNGDSHWASVSDDGRHVAFHSAASDLVPGDVGGHHDVFLWDRVTGTTTRIAAGNGESWFPSIDGDGSTVAFHSSATDLAPGSQGPSDDVFVWRRATGAITAVTAGDAVSDFASISTDGRVVAFTSRATDLLGGPPDPDPWSDIFTWDATTGQVARVTDGGGDSVMADVSADGRRIAFSSWSPGLVPGDVNGEVDAFLWDGTSDATGRLTDAAGHSYSSSISGDGGTVALYSESGLVQGDVDRHHDVYLWEVGS